MKVRRILRLVGGAIGSVALTTFLLSPARAGVNVWTSQGPEGGIVPSIALDPSNPSTLYVGTGTGGGDGVFKTTNGADSWVQMREGLPVSGWVSALAVDPAAPATIYAGLDSIGVYRSTNAANTWVNRSNGISGRRIFALAIDSAGAAVYVGTDIGVFKTTDGGMTWSSTGLSSYVQTLVDDPTNAGTLYAGTLNDGVFKTTNGGASWVAVNTGLSPPYTTIRSLAIVPSAPSALYAGGSTNGYPVVYRTTNGGASWTAGSTGLNGEPYALTLDPGAPATVYAATDIGVYKSTSSGDTWSVSTLGTSSGALDFLSIAIDPASPSTVYAGAHGNGALGGPNGGMFKTIDAGATWTVVNHGLTNTVAVSVAVDASGVGVYQAGLGTRLVSSSDGGATWSGGLTFDPTQPSRSSFQFVVGTAPSAAGTAYAVESVDFGYKTTDGGSTWTAMPIGSATTCGSSSVIFAVAVKPTSASVVYVGTRCPSRHIMKTTNGGASWSVMASGLPSTLTITSLVINPAAPATIYAGTSKGLWKSTNSASSWTRVRGGIIFNALAIDPVTPTTLYGADSQGVIKSTNSGSTWTRVLSTAYPVTSVVVVPAHHTIVLAGGYGVVQSTDSGATWSSLNTGLVCPDVRSLAVNQAGTMLHAATGCGGVFDYTVG